MHSVQNALNVVASDSLTRSEAVFPYDFSKHTNMFKTASSIRWPENQLGST